MKSQNPSYTSDQTTKHIHDPSNAVKSYASEATIVVEKIFQREWHRFSIRAERSFYLHRLTGISMLLLSSSLPFLSTIETDSVRKIILPAIAVTIAFLSGFMSFMTFGESWKNYRRSELRTRYAREWWNTEILSAQFEKDPEKALDQAKAATITFLKTMDSIVNSEAESFFRKLEEVEKIIPKGHP